MEKRFTIGMRAIVAFGLALAVLVVHAVLALVNVEVVAENEARVKQSYEVLGVVRAALLAVQEAESGERGYLISGDERYLQRYREGHDTFREQIAKLKKQATGSPRWEHLIQELESSAVDRFTELDQAIHIRQTAGFEAAQAAEERGDGLQAMIEIRDAVEAMLTYEQALLNQRAEQSRRAVDTAISASLVVGLLGAGVICIAYGLVRREIVQRRESQRFLRSVIDSLTSHIAVLDGNGVILEVNDAWSSAGRHGEFCADGIGDNYLQQCQVGPQANEDSRRLAEGIRQVIAGRSDSFLMQYAAPCEGQQRWFVARVTRFSLPGPVRVVVAHDDVTHRVLAELHIGQRSRQLQRLAEISMHLGDADSVREILETVARDGRLLIGAHQSLVSAVVESESKECIDLVSLSEKYAGWSEEGFFWRDAEVEQTICRLAVPLRMTQAEVEAHPSWRNLLANEKRPPLRGWLSAPFVGRDGRSLGFIQLSDKYEGDFTAEDEAILMQLARLAAIAIENTGLYQQLQENNRRKDQFLAMLGHELRNPLAGIVTSAQVLPLLPPDDPERRKMEGIIQRQAGHMVRMVEDLLDVSRIARGKLTLERKRLDLVHLVEQSLEDYRHSHPSDELIAEVDTPAQPLFVQADATRLQQVITNLIHNACKFSEGPCRLRVRLTRDAERSQAVLSVRDHGIGMAAETLARLFEPFNQAESTIDRSRGGMGLGLALIRGLVTLHNGRITARSPGLGQGSEFIIELPLDLSTQPEEEHPAPSIPSVQFRRVLLIDDTKDALYPLQRMLTASGLEVACAYDGRSGLELAREFQPDAVLCDIGLPDGMDGYAVAAALRADSALNNVYLVAVTGYGQEEDRRQAQEAGFDYHLTKPVSKAALDQLVSMRPRFNGRKVAVGEGLG